MNKYELVIAIKQFLEDLREKTKDRFIMSIQQSSADELYIMMATHNGEISFLGVSVVDIPMKDLQRLKPKTKT